MPAPSALSGKFGKVTVGATNHKLKEWNLQPAVDLVDVTSFEADSDADNNVWRNFEQALATATVTISGVWDNNVKPTLTFWVGDEITLTLGFNGLVNFSGPFIVEQCNPNTQVDGVAGFSATCRLNGILTYPNA